MKRRVLLLTKTKLWTLLMIFIIGLIPCLPFVYNVEILTLNGSAFFSVLGFGLISLTLVVHQLLFEKEN